MLIVAQFDRTFHNPLEHSSVYPIQGSIADVQYLKSPTQKETRGGRAKVDVEVANTEFFEMFKEKQNIVRTRRQF
jgi:hypothetical protein